jgi:hypothetical protein
MITTYAPRFPLLAEMVTRQWSERVEQLMRQNLPPDFRSRDLAEREVMVRRILALKLNSQPRS